MRMFDTAINAIKNNLTFLKKVLRYRNAYLNCISSTPVQVDEMPFSLY